MGHLLRDEGIVPDLIISSTAKRARNTAKEAAQASGYEGSLSLDPDFYEGGSSDFVRALQEVPDDRDSVMVVAHNPGLEEFIEILTGEYVRMPTAALARVSLPLENWNDLRVGTNGTLQNVWLPKELPEEGE